MRKLALLILIIVLFAPNVFAEMWIRVDDTDKIIDASSHRANLSSTKEGVGTVYEVPKEPFPEWGDHYIDGKVVQDSIKRQEAIDEFNARKARAITIRDKLITKGFTSEEATDFVRAIFGSQ